MDGHQYTDDLDLCK